MERLKRQCKFGWGHRKPNNYWPALDVLLSVVVHSLAVQHMAGGWGGMWWFGGEDFYLMKKTFDYTNGGDSSHHDNHKDDQGDQKFPEVLIELNIHLILAGHCQS